eukprot:4820799-Lingulodinium_polyedra.AAC.1
MRSNKHSTAAAPRSKRPAHSTRRPPHGGRRMKRADCSPRGGAAKKRTLDRIYEHAPRETRSDTRSNMHPTAAAPR